MKHRCLYDAPLSVCSASVSSVPERIALEEPGKVFGRANGLFSHRQGEYSVRMRKPMRKPARLEALTGVSV